MGKERRRISSSDGFGNKKGKSGSDVLHDDEKAYLSYIAATVGKPERDLRKLAGRTKSRRPKRDEVFWNSASLKDVHPGVVEAIRRMDEKEGFGWG